MTHPICKWLTHTLSYRNIPPDERVSGLSLIEIDMFKLLTTSSSNSGLNLKKKINPNNVASEHILLVWIRY